MLCLWFFNIRNLVICVTVDCQTLDYVELRNLFAYLSFVSKHLIISNDEGGGGDLFRICKYLFVSLIFWRSVIALIHSFLTIRSLCRGPISVEILRIR